MNVVKNILTVGCIGVSVLWLAGTNAKPARTSGYRKVTRQESGKSVLPEDSGKSKLKYPIKDSKSYELGKKGHMDLKDPKNMTTSAEMDTSGGGYVIRRKAGNFDTRPPFYMSTPEYLKYSQKQFEYDYFKKRAASENFVKGGGGIMPQLYVQQKVFDNIFGSGVVDLHPQGSAELIFGVNTNVVRNPALSPRQQKNSQFDFDQKIQLNLTGTIGDKMKVNSSFNTESTFDFENIMKLDYAGKEDDILKKIELGNVTLPLNSNLIQGGQTLFGVKTQMQFGRLSVTSIFTQQKGKTTSTEFTGGAQTTQFDLTCDNYDMNRHFFLGQYFRDHFDEYLSRLPLINSPIKINRVEVWVTNRSNAYQDARDVLAFMDLGEGDPYNKTFNPGPYNRNVPSNANNKLYATMSADPNIRSSFDAVEQLKNNYPQLNAGVDFQLQNYARQLTAQEYTVNEKLGYISLKSALNNGEVLAVAFEYTLNGIPYKVGEFAQEVAPDSTRPNVLMLKLLKGYNVRPDLPVWDLMMKNIYSLNSYQVQAKDFKLNIIYNDPSSGTEYNFIPAKNEPLIYNIPLIKVLNVDNLNAQQDQVSDGVFDFIDGVTILVNDGKIIFPCVEPFGSYLEKKFDDKTLAQRYVFKALYDSTRFAAQQQAQYNRYYIRGSYQGSSSNEISLNAFNVPQGSVKVTANGSPLRENIDYTVDYQMGKVKIINTGILNSGAVIRVQAENNTLFNVQQKSLYGSRFDYKITNDILVGGTILHMKERPLTQNVSIGDEPLNNTIVGIDGTFRRDVRFITKLIDKLPLIETKEISSITFNGEYAHLFPGVPKTLDKTGKGFSYIDDFQGAETPIELRVPMYWVNASTPAGQPAEFIGSNLSGHQNRDGVAKLSWYNIEPITFYGNVANTPKNISKNMISNHYMRPIRQKEIYPNRDIPNTTSDLLQTLDIAYFPNIRGPYNYNANGLNSDGTLSNPQSRWGGMMRRIETNDFEAANVDYINMWLMDPFYYNQSNSGDFIIQLGNISEDVLRDGRKSFENGLPKTATKVKVDSTDWGLVPTLPMITPAFDNDPASREFQDVGLDGLGDADEQKFFDTVFLAKVRNLYGANSIAYQTCLKDPSADNYHYFLGNDLDSADANIIKRYMYINNQEGNSPTSEQSQAKTGLVNSAYTQTPDDEDIDRDFLMNTTEDYFQYKVKLDPSQMVVGQNFITDKQVKSVVMPDGSTQQITWYQIKVPIAAYEKKIGQINDFKSIRFMRVILKGFQDSIICRFAEFQLIRSDWRKYLLDLRQPDQYIPVDPKSNTRFDVATVNIEENGRRSPINYVVPPGINRQFDPTNTQLIRQNEQSLSMTVCGLEDGDGRAVFKNTRFDIRNYKRLKMFIHAEEFANSPLNDGDLVAFIRLGTDFNSNYYEYELPLKVVRAGNNDPTVVWPTEDELDIEIDKFYQAKQERQLLNAPLTQIFQSVQNPGVSILGVPDMSNVRVIMIGVRNPKNDGVPKCGEVWFNELRVTDFNNVGGSAAQGRLVAKLADVGNVTVSGSMFTFGWGALDKKLNDRSRNDGKNYSILSNFELGKLFPQKAGVSIPLFIGYSNDLIRPYFNPLNPDVKMTTALETARRIDPMLADALKNAADDVTGRYSLNLTNVRKNRAPGKKPHFYDIENFYATYSYNNIFKRGPSVTRNESKIYKGILAYSYQFPQKNWQPFKKINKSKYLTLIRDFNINLLPNSFNTRIEVDRRYNILELRNNDFRNNNFALTNIAATYDKDFTMNRVYDLQWNLSRALKMDYNALMNARIPEPYGAITTAEQRDTIKNNFFKLGEARRFNQNIAFNYNLPFSKLPLTDWITANTRYAVTLDWTGAPIALVKDTLGSLLQNSRNLQVNAQFNMIQLYNKVPLFKKINMQQGNKAARGNSPAPEKDKKSNKEKGKGKDDKDKEKEKKVDEEPAGGNQAVIALAKLVMSLKNVSVNYVLTDGSALPGFLPMPKYFGENPTLHAPGYKFILGDQDTNFKWNAAKNGWLTNKIEMNNPYSHTMTQNLNGRATLEPFNDFRVEVNFSRQMSSSQQGIFRIDTTDGFNDYRNMAPVTSGNFSMSFLMINSAFVKDLKGGNNDLISPTFEQFQNNRFDIATRLQEVDRATTGATGIDPITKYPFGYSQKSQDVLILSFLSAYTGKNPISTGLSVFPKIPLPNWRVTYNGLSKLKAVNKWASNISISHAYSSTYNVNSFTSSIFKGYDTLTRSFIPDIIIRNISITERMTPLIGVDVTLLNNMTFAVKYNQDRTLNFSLNNFQLAEVRNKEFVFGFGYRTREVNLPFRIQGKRAYLENDVNTRVDISIRDNITFARQMDMNQNLPAAGSKVISIKPNIDYMINDYLNIRFYYDRVVTKPHVSLQFPTAISRGGISIRYTLNENFLKQQQQKGKGGGGGGPRGK